MLKKIFAFIFLIILLIILLFVAIRSGSINLTYTQIFNGLFIKYDEEFATIYDLRFPRILVAILAGAGLSVSGVMFQAVMKNPLADPGTIGISSGASFISMIVTFMFPKLYFLSPLFAFIGGVLACILVYTLSWKDGLKPLRVILVGVAVNAVFVGLLNAINAMSGGSQNSVTAIVNANIAQKTWKDVSLLSTYISIGMLLALIFSGRCNLLALEDKTIKSLGINVNRLRIYISAISLLLIGISTAVVGVIGFIGLIVPHMSRMLVGNDNRVLIPYSMILGAFVMLLADTVGRIIIMPFEIPIGVFMSVFGGPFFIILLRKSEGTYESQ